MPTVNQLVRDGRVAKRGNGLEQPFPVAEVEANLLEIGVGKIA